MGEEGKDKSMVIRYWPQLAVLCIVCIAIGRSLNSQEGLFAKVNSVEDEHTSDVRYLNEEDDGVRGDFERADDCSREVASLENEVLYWKIKYETK